MRGRKDVVCFKDFVSYIISDKLHEGICDDVGTKAEEVIKSAARLIRAQIREVNFDMNKYPN